MVAGFRNGVAKGRAPYYGKNGELRFGPRPERTTWEHNRLYRVVSQGYLKGDKNLPTSLRAISLASLISPTGSLDCPDPVDNTGRYNLMNATGVT